MENSDDRLTKILLLQRIIRSFYVRRQLELVRKEYLQTLSDIEGPLPVEPVKKLEPSKPSRECCEGFRMNVCLFLNKFLFSALVETPPNRDDLLRRREEIAMELLWIEQAIQSRKDYLRLKSRYTGSVS